MKCVCLDGEGVLWSGQKPIEGAAESVERFRELGYRVVIITNNANRNSKQYVDRLNAAGFKGFTPDDIVTTSVCTKNFLIKKGFANSKRKVFAIGTAGFVNELRSANIEVITASDFDGLDYLDVDLDPTVCAVVVGTSEEFGYRHIAIATRFVIENDAILLSANADGSYPYNKRVLIPGAYAISACIGAAANRDPIVLGKPSPMVWDALVGKEQIDMDNCWFIGDRLNTDVVFAKKIGSKSILVLTGVSREEEVVGVAPENRPDYICKDLSECIAILQK